MLQTNKTDNQNEETMAHLQQTVNKLLETLIKPDRLKRDIFFILLHSVMKENNFVLNKKIGETSKESVSIIEYILQEHTSNGESYEALFILDDFIHMPVKLICSPITDVILVTATIPQIYKETYSVCFKIDKFITTSECGTPVTFASLDELFSLFKEKVVTPLRGVILYHHNYASGCLSGLPDHLLHLILLLLPIRDILNLANCCRRIYAVVKEQSLWFQLYRRDFPDKNVSEQSDWYDTYKEIYALTKAERYEHASNVGADIFEEFRVLPGHLRAVDSRWEVIL